MSVPAPVDPAVGEAGRNEARKHRATYLNNISAGLLLAGLIQPVLGVVQRQREVGLVELGFSAMFIGLAVALFMFSQAVAGRMED